MRGRWREFNSCWFHKQDSFFLQISTCLSSLDSSEVFDRGFETGAKFWCYFCEEEFSKHTLFEDCTVKNGGFLTHLSRYKFVCMYF